MQGDIVGLLDESGNSVVQYKYDIWGGLLSITGSLADTLGAANPLRYRGYYYDSETELYYLQSRYYSPELMRFISQDDPYYSNAQGQPLGSNLYAYCLNNPVMGSDPSGYLKVSSHWWGFRMTLSNDETKKLLNFLDYYRAGIAIIGIAGRGVTTIVIGILLNVLVINRRHKLKAMNKGKGVLIDFNWATVLLALGTGAYITPVMLAKIQTRT